MGFRENLKSELAFSNMLVKELAARAGIPVRTLDNYLREQSSMPSAEAAVKIARVLGVSVEYLVTGADAPARAAPASPAARAAALIIEELPEGKRNIALSFLRFIQQYEYGGFAEGL